MDESTDILINKFTQYLDSIEQIINNHQDQIINFGMMYLKIDAATQTIMPLVSILFFYIFIRIFKFGLKITNWKTIEDEKQREIFEKYYFKDINFYCCLISSIGLIISTLIFFSSIKALIWGIIGIIYPEIYAIWKFI